MGQDAGGVVMIAPTRPALRYFGGKWRLAPWIISHFPEHTCYVEPFAGGASVLLRKPESKVEVLNDLDGEVVNFWRVLREQTEAFIRAVELTPFSREEASLAYQVADDPLERARRLFIRSWQQRGGDLAPSGALGGGIRPAPAGPIFPATIGRRRITYGAWRPGSRRSRSRTETPWRSCGASTARRPSSTSILRILPRSARADGAARHISTKEMTRYTFVSRRSSTAPRATASSAATRASSTRTSTVVGIGWRRRRCATRTWGRNGAGRSSG